MKVKGEIIVALQHYLHFSRDVCIFVYDTILISSAHQWLDYVTELRKKEKKL